MATITKLRRVANPGGGGRKRKRFARAMRNAKGRFVKRSSATRRKVKASSKRHKSRAPVIRRYSSKVLKSELKRRGVGGGKRNPRRTRAASGKTHRRHSRTRNPMPMLIELGVVNPRKGRKSMAKRKYRRAKVNSRRRRRVNPVARVTRRRRRSVGAVRRYRRRRSNPVAVHHVTRRRRRYTRHHSVGRRRMNRRYARRNPAVFGVSGGKDMLLMVGGGLVGVAATKFLPTLIPASLTASLGSSPIISILITGAGAFAAGYLARRFVGSVFGDAVLFGGLMQTGSAALTAFAPSYLSSQLALSGVGDIVPGNFVVPQNPITSRPPMAMIAGGKGGVAGFGPGGFGYRRS